MDIQQATRSYEAWVAQYARPVKPDVRLKHERMASSPFVFLRGTFYRWLQLFQTGCESQLRAPRVLAVGDLHIENFGTWRDAEGRLIWGVNDVDEAARLPYSLDLVRLATSAVLARREERLVISVPRICDAILEGYQTALTRAGRPFVLAERTTWLRDIATNKLRDPVEFWRKLDALPAVTKDIPEKTLRAALPDARLDCKFVRRIAGVGSLGRPRIVALALWGGARIAREAKARVPSAAHWAQDRTPEPSATDARILARAVRVADPFFSIDDKWVVRRLAPDCSRIEMVDLPFERDEARLLRAMGWEAANIHLGSANRQLGGHLARQPKDWLETAARAMARAVVKDWREWATAGA